LLIGLFCFPDLMVNDDVDFVSGTLFARAFVLIAGDRFFSGNKMVN